MDLQVLHQISVTSFRPFLENPDVIVVNGEPKSNKSGRSAAEDILNNPDYASFKATIILTFSKYTPVMLVQG